jgi:hypothetical protein
MQKFMQVALISGFSLFLLLAQGCKKDKEEENPNSWTEEFVDMENLIQNQWMVFNNGIDAFGTTWQQGFYEIDKMGGYLGFKAYSSSSGDFGEFAFAGQTSFTLTSVASSWLVTAPVQLKNDDKFSFYTRCDSSIVAPQTLEVRLSPSEFPTAGTGPADVGNFTQLLYTVNPNKTLDGYPLTWKKIEVTVSGLPAEIKGRIAFRYMSMGQLDGGIGIDQLVYTSK